MPTHKTFRLGKKAAKFDTRTIRLSAILTETPVAVPSVFHTDLAYPGSPIDALGNTQYGDCVIAAQGHQMRRFELFETGQQLALTETEVVKEYLRQGNGKDRGLVMLDSLKLQRSRGWVAGGQLRNTYAFASIDLRSRQQIMQTIFSRLGCQIGVSLPLSAQREMNAGKSWAQTTGAGSQPGTWGGHAIWVEGYEPSGLTCITWGHKQHMTWEWLAKYCDEAYAVIDAVNAKKTKRLINRGKLESQLANVA